MKRLRFAALITASFAIVALGCSASPDDGPARSEGAVNTSGPWNGGNGCNADAPYEVKLITKTLTAGNGCQGACAVLEMTIGINNSRCIKDKNVVVHYRLDGGSEQTLAAYYADAVDPLRKPLERWRAALNLPSPQTKVQFYITYEVGGMNFRDDNGGKNYEE